ncbi:unnamed protein product [Adineta ricciae]|uniref:EGF-like domain-containing protein n=1 Tax=Adineta ricciae TaxID=249248 RepID=A0A815CSB3_ADIRI|nr:unnamed protein product [Adineta ricciae]CAF1287558.1 unnamed protein product [Adineta ricciae]
MTVNQRRLLKVLFISFLLTPSTILVEAIAGRCYLCSQKTLAECAGNAQPDSPLYHTILQYYTEPCNGQCVLFRSEDLSTIRGCSWTYGHMTAKSTGWHELTPGIRAYFCDSYLCNNGTFDQPEKAIFSEEAVNNEFHLPQQLPILSGNALSLLPNGQHVPPIDNLHHQLRQCYSCTAHQKGCNEYLDPHYVSTYIRPCPASCILFRNPNDHNILTRDCSIAWPQVHAKNGLHKLLGSDAFFCQESLCNGIGFDLIMGIFHNQMPAIVTFPPSPPIDIPSTTTTTTTVESFPSEVVTDTISIDPTMNTVDVDVHWEDPDLDFVLVEPTVKPTPAIPFATTPLPLASDIPDDVEFVAETSTVLLPSIEHFDLLDEIFPSSTIVGGIAVAQQDQDSQINWWDVDEASLPSVSQSNQIPLATTTTASNIFTIIPSTNKLTESNDDYEWNIFNTTSVSLVTPLNHQSDSNSEIEFDMNDYFTFPTSSTTAILNFIKNQTQPLLPFYFSDDNTKEQLAGLNKPASTLAVPPFSWMLQLANQPKNVLRSRQSILSKTLTTISTATISKRKNKKTTLTLRGKSNNQFDHFYELCQNKQCKNGGRLNSDCLCICLPAFSGNHCEIVHCDQEPTHICDFVLDHECKSDYVRYLCPKFCQMNICSTNKSS